MLSGGEDIQMIQNYLKEGTDNRTDHLQIALNIIQKYNLFGKTQNENYMKQHLLHCISSTLPLSKAKKLGLKVGNTNYIQNQKSNFQILERKKNIKRITQDLDRKTNVVSFLNSNCRYAANKTVKIKNENVGVKYLNDSVSGLFLKYNKSALSSLSVSISFFRSIIKKEKIFKNAKKETDKCSHCKIGKKSVKSLNKLLKKVNEDKSKLTLEEIEIVKKLENGIEVYNHHKDTASKQYNSFKFKKQINVLKEKGVKHCLIVLDFKENIKLSRGLVEYDHDFHNKPIRTVLGFIIYFVDSNGIYHKKHFNIISEILSHDAGFVINAFEKLISQGWFQFKSMDIFMDCGPHFRCQELLHYLFIEKKELNIMVHFFGEKHGKSPVDSHFSILSRWLIDLDRNVHIDSTEGLISGWTKKINESNEIKKLKKDKTDNIPFDIEFFVMNEIRRDEFIKGLQIADLKTYMCLFKVKGEELIIKGGIHSDSILNSIPFNITSTKQIKKIKKSNLKTPEVESYSSGMISKFEKQTKILKENSSQNYNYHLNLMKTSKIVFEIDKSISQVEELLMNDFKSMKLEDKLESIQSIKKRKNNSTIIEEEMTEDVSKSKRVKIINVKIKIGDTIHENKIPFEMKDQTKPIKKLKNNEIEFKKNQNTKHLKVNEIETKNKPKEIKIVKESPSPPNSTENKSNFIIETRNQKRKREQEQRTKS